MKYYLLFIFYSFYFSLFFVVLLDVIVFTQVVFRFEQKQCCRLSSEAINMVCPIHKCVQPCSQISNYIPVALEICFAGARLQYRNVIKAGYCVNYSNTDTSSLCLHCHLESL